MGASFSWLRNYVLPDKQLWSRDLERHPHGEYSFAVAQSNVVLADKSHVESGIDATFVGIYDGHHWDRASSYVEEHLFQNLLEEAQKSHTINIDTIRRAFSATEHGFLELVRKEFHVTPIIAAAGSCCLVGVIFDSNLFIANLGDSRAVIGYLNERDRTVAKQLTRDHKVSNIEVRKEVKSQHRGHQGIVVLRDRVWRIKDILKVSRSIGDAFLKNPAYALDKIPMFHLRQQLTRPVIRDDPEITITRLQMTHKFVIFASDGLWRLLDNQEAVDIVEKGPTVGIAKKLIEAALKKAAWNRCSTYEEMKQLDTQERRDWHDDITVVVLFIDPNTINTPPRFSVHGFRSSDAPSRFRF